MSATIYSYSIIYSAAEAFKDKTPYVIALIEENGQPRRMAQIEGYQDGLPIKIGMKVARSGEDVYGNPVFKFI